MYDILVRGGEVVDGSGRPRVKADVGIVGERIAAIGDLSGAEATRVIDASGRVITPGFIDVHTHIDAQVFWDSTVSPSPLHGVTTVIAGNCGFSVQPLSNDPADGDYLIRMLSRVEGMPLASLLEGAPWDWVSTADYLDALEHRLSVNAAFKVGHSALRRVVMGAACTQRTATPEEVQQMCDLLRAGIQAGAIGFSSSWSTTHNDTEQNMVPSRYADRDEMIALCSVLADFPGTSLEFIPCIGPFGQAEVDLMADMSLAAKAPLNWNVLPVNERNREFVEGKLAASDAAAARGAKVVGLTAPMALDFRLSFSHGFLLDAVPGWEAPMLLPHEEKKALLADPERRKALGDLAAKEHMMRHFTHWSQMIIFYTVAPENAGYVGRRIGEIADELGKTPWDTICDISLADDLRTSFGHPSVDEPDATWQARVDVWRDPRAIIGASDAGAHLDMFFSADYATRLLGEAVVKRKLLPLEEAVHYITQVPAELYQLRDRGRVREGAFADLVVLDEHTVSSNPMDMRADLPGGAARLYAEANGIDHVLCNGREIVSHGVFTDERPGTILRTGVHTG
ncbi:MAG TPA: amidohydrolase family protein [Ilumatobacteraceae bacterium]|nr:amidohydrolase family protein [Ilumatobacteraceae bacterium]